MDKICVVGCGYIGLSTATSFASKGVEVTGVDVDEKKIEDIKKGILEHHNLEEWMGISIMPFIEKGMIHLTTDWENAVKDHNIFFVAIPTEKFDRPWYDALDDVVDKIAKHKPDATVIIESTLAPGTTDKRILPKLKNTVVAPRRDWFTLEYNQTLENMPRVVGATTPELLDKAVEIIGKVSKDIRKASSYKTVEMVKAYENSQRHAGCVIAQQLANAYPELDVNEIMQLGGSKWNVQSYYPGLRTSGYCIPLSSKYLLEGATHPERLDILKAMVNQDDGNVSFITNYIYNKFKSGKVGILSLCYLGDIKVHILSPTLYLVKELKKYGFEVKVHDPYYSGDEIKEILNCDNFDFPEQLEQFDLIIVVANHKAYKEIPEDSLFNALHQGQHILDNSDTWDKFRDKFKEQSIEYHRIGDAGWLS